ncbi:MAG: EAL domain-containing protein [Cellulomonas sp.]
MIPPAGATHERNELERDLREPLSSDEIDLVYQPIVATTDGSVTDVESSLQWTHPSRSPISAATAITIAEQSGMIAALGQRVLRRRCLAWVAWRGQHPDTRLDLFVNVWVGQLMALGFAATVAGVLDATGMDPTALVLEDTEGIFFEDGERAMNVLRELRSPGSRLALDDFGTGESSLNYLRRFSVDIVKIDQSLVADIGHDTDATTMVAAVTHLAHDLGKTVTAEGVETADQCDQIMAIDCERAQGYFFARPMSATNFATHFVNQLT